LDFDEASLNFGEPLKVDTKVAIELTEHTDFRTSAKRRVWTLESL